MSEGVLQLRIPHEKDIPRRQQHTLTGDDCGKVSRLWRTYGNSAVDLNPCHARLGCSSKEGLLLLEGCMLITAWTDSSGNIKPLGGDQPVVTLMVRQITVTKFSY